MTVGSGISVSDGKLMVSGNCILSDVHQDIVITPARGDGLINGAFIGVLSDHKGSHLVFPVGKLEGLRFLSIFRFNLWWMTHRMGSSGKEIPYETQCLIVEGIDGTQLSNERGDVLDDSIIYTVFLPILEGDFRAALQGNPNNELEICLESGDPAVDWFEGTHLVFMVAGPDPFDVITDAVKAVEKHLQTFSHREHKKVPDMINWFGWCTWDAFYTDVTAEGVKQGLESLEKGGTPPKFVIIDDGWQRVDMDASGISMNKEDAANFANRLIHIKENYKFQKNSKDGHRIEDPATGLAHIITEIKGSHAVKYVFLWHALTGYWADVSPSITEMEHYESKVIFPVLSPGLQCNKPCEVFNNIAANGVGLVNPEKASIFYDELHSYLASAGIDGVKVDVQNLLETLAAGHGGRVNITRKFHEALDASIARNFRGNGIISCMSHNTDGLYSSKQTAVMRASDDFFPKIAASHTIHIAAVAYNTIFIGEFMQPDWDMFHSLHPMAGYHAAARAVGGCAIYVSDKPEHHDFDLLKKLVLPDGSVLRAKLPGKPTRDCLFSDPTIDGKSLLKIWNLNDFSGVLGVFNCQGEAISVEGIVSSKDVDYISKVAEHGWNGDAIIYSHLGGNVVYQPKNISLPIKLKSREYEVFTVVPVKELSNGANIAPIGLTQMFNSGGAIKELTYESERCSTVVMKVRGCGVFGAYSSAKPRRITVDEEEVEFTYDEKSHLVTLTLRIPEQELYQWHITIEL
ncbi:probable galactinol--sucrose galactosyltransferase 1 [Macadamia integrifolia]|uniref:probable galactinol--sucrose galactosyltransferase 1 n=1 Tax=Macadamia integrifolia TaxID=60698 RepID=UPI001C53355E|nr:probable galactinol--sucrose galactosyltransferase 1 [Macadamia integrifolia]